MNNVNSLFKIFGTLLLAIFIFSCKKDINLSGSNGGNIVQSKFQKISNQSQPNLMIDTNTVLKLGVLDSITINKIYALTLEEQKIFWNIITDIEAGMLDNLYGGYTLMNTASLNVSPFPMIDSLYGVPDTNAISSIFLGNFSKYVTMTNPHFTSVSNIVTNLNDLINLIPTVAVPYIYQTNNSLSYSIAYFSETPGYFSIVFFSSDSILELPSNILPEEYKEESPAYPSYTLSEDQLNFRKFIYEQFTGNLKKMHPYYPRSRYGNW